MKRPFLLLAFSQIDSQAKIQRLFMDTQNALIFCRYQNVLMISYRSHMLIENCAIGILFFQKLVFSKLKADVQAGRVTN